MRPFTIYPEESFLTSVEEISTYVNGGEIIAFPTETVFGLGVCRNNFEAINNLYNLKGRDKTKAMILHVSDLNVIEEYVDSLPELFHILAKEFFPGPLTLVVKKKKSIGSLPFAMDNTIAFRMPDNEIALKLIDALGGGIVATSANISGEPNLITHEDVAKHFKDKIFGIIEGECKHKLPSTVLKIEEDNFCKILREGAITRKKLETFLKKSCG